MRRYIGWVILGTLIFYLLGILNPFFMNLAAFFAWFFLFKDYAIFERTERENT